MIEVKKDSYKQCQNGITRMGFTFAHSDIPEQVKDAELGHRYYVVFVDADMYDESEGKCTQVADSSTSDNLSPVEKSEGDKIRERACILCGDRDFQEWLGLYSEESTASYMRRYCNIKSRSELTTNKEAQAKFKELDRKFKSWKFEQRYADNLER